MEGECLQVVSTLLSTRIYSQGLPLVVGCSISLGTAGGAGRGTGVYDFFAFIKPARSEKLSRCAVRRMLGDILLLIEPKVVGEVGLELRPPFAESAESAESARLMRSSFASRRRSVESFRSNMAL